MSRNEGEEEEVLLVCTVFLFLKTVLLRRVTVVREGMSVGDDGVMGNTLKSDETRIVECVTAIRSGEGNEFRQVYSSLRLCITTAHDQFSRVLITEHECIFTQLYGGQFWQI